MNIPSPGVDTTGWGSHAENSRGEDSWRKAVLGSVAAYGVVCEGSGPPILNTKTNVEAQAARDYQNSKE